MAQGQRTLASNPILTKSAVVLAESFSIKPSRALSAASEVIESARESDLIDSPSTIRARTLRSISDRLATKMRSPPVLCLLECRLIQYSYSALPNPSTLSR